jgi:transcriptional regulator with XRE-family HTH domain
MTPTGAWEHTNVSPPTGGDLTEPTKRSETRTDLTELRESYATLRDETRILHHDTASGHKRVRRYDLNQRAAEHARQPLPEVLDSIYDRGFSWRDIARSLGVSVPALRKWRYGEHATARNRTKAARLLAVCEYLEENVPTVSDVAGWFEIPLVPDPAITPLELYADGREDLVLDYAEQQEPDPNAVLDRFDPSWRDRRSDYEVVVAEDGLPSIQRRS